MDQLYFVIQQVEAERTGNQNVEGYVRKTCNDAFLWHDRKKDKETEDHSFFLLMGSDE